MEAFKQFPKVYIRYQENQTDLTDRMATTQPAEDVTWPTDSIEILLNILPLIRQENGKFNINYNFTHLSYILKINKQAIYMKLIELYHLQGDRKKNLSKSQSKMLSEERGKAQNERGEEEEEKEEQKSQVRQVEDQQEVKKIKEQRQEEKEMDTDQLLVQNIPGYDTSVSADNTLKDKLELLKIGSDKSTLSLSIGVENFHGKNKLSSSISSNSNSSSTSSASAINIANASMYLQRTRILNPQSGSLHTPKTNREDEASGSEEGDGSEGYLLGEGSLGSSLLEEEVLKRI